MNTGKTLFRCVQLVVPHRLMTKLSMTLFLAVVFGSPLASSAPQGELDASFGENGRLMLGPGIFEFGYGRAITQQSADGKLLIAGDVENQIVVLRLNTDGSLDDAFGANSIATINFGQAGETVYGLVLQPDGKIVVAGSVYSDLTTGVPEADFALARLNSDGTIDATFGADGLVTLDLGGSYEFIRGVSLLQNGQIVVTGTTDARGHVEVAFARFDAGGQLDTTFGTGPVAGTTLIDTNGQNAFARNDEPLWITRQLDGKFVACGFADTDYWDYWGTMLAVRVNVDGSPDAGFGANGVTRVETDSDAQTCIAMPDGTIVLAGAKYQNRSDLMFARLTSDGMTDPTFGNSGISKIDLGGYESVRAMILLNDGSLGVTGRTGTIRGNIYGSPTDMFFARIDPDSGLLDPSFGNQGATIVDFGLAGQTANSEGIGIVQQADGKIVAMGTTNDGESPVVAMARVNTDGSGNTGFAGWTYTSDRVVESTGEIVVGVRRTGGSTGTLSVDYNTVAGSAVAPNDFSATFGTLTWPSGNMHPKTVTVPITRDSTQENDEYFRIALMNSTNGLAASDFLVTISETAAPVSSGGGNDNGNGGRSADSGGGGAISNGLLILMAMTAASAYRRRRITKRVGRVGAAC